MSDVWPRSRHAETPWREAPVIPPSQSLATKKNRPQVQACGRSS